jgi:hypothetical protein
MEALIEIYVDKALFLGVRSDVGEVKSVAQRTSTAGRQP